MVAKFALVGFAFTALACGPVNVQVSAVGQRVEIVGVESAVAACRFVANLNSRIGENFRTYDTNVGLAENDLRNQAAQRGATHILVGAPVQQASTAFTKDCRNCVQLSARAFRCNGGDDAPAVARPAAAAPPVDAAPPTVPPTAAANAPALPHAAACVNECQRDGLCALVDGKCGAGSDADCRDSKACKLAGRCRAVGAKCVQ